jgi:murein DD-endopeptidase MepM/ murein hydrolase activator NlpD
MFAAALIAASVAVAGDIVHVVRKGETLSAISKKFHVPVADILKHNHLASAGAIKIGQKLKIPAKQSSPAKPKTAPAVPVPAQATPDPAPPVETAAMDTILPEPQPETMAATVQPAPAVKKPPRMSTKTKFFILFVVQTIVSGLLAYLIALWVVNRGGGGGYKRGA